LRKRRGDWGLFMDVRNAVVTVPGTLNAYELNLGHLLRWADRNAISYINSVGTFLSADPGLFVTSPYTAFYGQVEATQFITTSDARLKRNITPIGNAVEKLQKIRGVIYEFDNEC